MKEIREMGIEGGELVEASHCATLIQEITECYPEESRRYMQIYGFFCFKICSSISSSMEGSS